MPSTTTTNLPPALLTHPGCLLYDLLMSPLDAAVPLKQVDSVAVHVPEHLNLHVSAIREADGGVRRRRKNHSGGSESAD